MDNTVDAFTYHNIQCKSAIRKLKKHKGPYEYDMNIYRGCAHRCAYCYAIYSQRYMEEKDFFHTIYIKENIVEQLKKQLSSPNWKHSVISIGTICDAYQPIEATRNIMPEILKVLIHYKTPCIILTKSDLILRDIDLIKQLASIAYVGIGASITSLDEKITRIVEPGAVTGKRRLAMLQQMKEKTNAAVGLHMMPIMPYINDSDEQIEEIMKAAKDIHVNYIIFGILNLIGDTKRHFFQVLEKKYPHLVSEYQRLYPQSHLHKAYQADIYKRIAHLQKTYQLNQDYMKDIRKFHQQTSIEQLTLW